MPRGGRRPGAGAPRGNLNALKHGLRSRQLRQLTEELARSPTMRAYLARLQQLAARRALSQSQGPVLSPSKGAKQARDTAAIALAAWLRYTRALAQGEPWEGAVPLPPFSYRQARLLAKHLAHQTIEQGLLNCADTDSMNINRDQAIKMPARKSPRR